MLRNSRNKFNEQDGFSDFKDFRIFAFRKKTKIMMKNTIFILFTIIISLLSLTNCKNSEEKKENETAIDKKLSHNYLSKKIKQISDEIKKHPNKAINYFNRAKLYETDNKLMLAIKDMEKAVSINKENFKYYNYQAKLYFDATNIKAAIKSYKKSISINSKDDYAFIRLGEIYLYQAKPQECVENLNSALRRNKYNPETYALKSSYYLQMKDTARAISNLRTSIDVDPDYFNSYLDLGYLYSLKNNADGIVYYTNALNLQPSNTKVLYNRALLYQNIDSFNKAITDYKKILEINSIHKSANYNLGYIFFLKEKYEMGIKYFTKSISAAPQYYEAYFGRAICYDSLNNKEKARKDYQKILSNKPDDKIVKQALSKLNN
ncbi:MAG: tetratricopeptide repeat protein [Bacteroidota bacterium]|nr:tetratricopeptide repeat protein [Bacteroidota bacterium]